MPTSAYVISKYKKGRLCGAGPFDLMMMAYSEAIRGCTTQNAEHAKTAIQLLLDNLDQKHNSPLSRNLAKSYTICLNLVEKNKYELAADLLQTLRQSWREAYRQLG